MAATAVFTFASSVLQTADTTLDAWLPADTAAVDKDDTQPLTPPPSPPSSATNAPQGPPTPPSNFNQLVDIASGSFRLSTKLATRICDKVANRLLAPATKEHYANQVATGIDFVKEKKSTIVNSVKEKQSVLFETVKEKQSVLFETVKEKRESVAQQAASYVSPAVKYVTPIATRITNTTKPYVEKLFITAAPYIEKAKNTAMPVVEQAKISIFSYKTLAIEKVSQVKAFAYSNVAAQLEKFREYRSSVATNMQSFFVQKYQQVTSLPILNTSMKQVTEMTEKGDAFLKQWYSRVITFLRQQKEKAA